MSNLSQLAYISRSDIKGSTAEIEKQISAILKQSQANNKEHEITGALLYSGGYFCQVIEGPEAEVLARFKRIQSDSRHKGVTVLHYLQIDDRAFPEWAMAYAGIHNKLHFNIEEIRDSKDELKAREAGKKLINFLDTLLNTHQSRMDTQ